MLSSIPLSLATNSPMPELAPVTKLTFPANLLDDDIGAALAACYDTSNCEGVGFKLYVDPYTVNCQRMPLPEEFLTLEPQTGCGLGILPPPNAIGSLYLYRTLGSRLSTSTCNRGLKRWIKHRTASMIQHGSSRVPIPIWACYNLKSRRATKAHSITKSQ